MFSYKKRKPKLQIVKKLEEDQEDQSAKESLNEFYKEQKIFEQNSLWKEINCTPNDFFKKLKEEIKAKKIPEEFWKDIYETKAQEYRIQALEKIKQERILKIEEERIKNPDTNLNRDKKRSIKI